MIEEHLPARLYLLGLHGVSRVVTHTNRSVMVSIGKRRVLRIHVGYAYASDSVLRAIIRFLDPRLPRAVRRAAERELLAFPVERYASSVLPRQRPERRQADIGQCCGAPTRVKMYRAPARRPGGTSNG